MLLTWGMPWLQLLKDLSHLRSACIGFELTFPFRFNLDIPLAPMRSEDSVRQNWTSDSHSLQDT